MTAPGGHNEFVPLRPPPRSRRGVWVGLILLVIFALLLGVVYVVINWADSGSSAQSLGLLP